ncbi:MAG: hypothetical protein J6X11_04880 [Treponema sp.]|nr:hypothetical protein [Treponema sp.]MBR4385439.1 hypothetical protein [Treponema sp.]
MTQKKDFSLSQEELASFISLVTLNTGIIPRESHKTGIKTYIERTLAENSLSASEYKRLIDTKPNLLSELVNASTVNETYFFREEKQFSILKERLFPQWKASFGTMPIRIWSAACSYGEEAYSISLLARECKITADITASDINSEVLEHCKQGLFLGSSIRQMDGLAFKNLLIPYQREDKKIEFPPQIKNSIHTKKINLAKIDSPETEKILPQNQSIIFLRNVFIYFSQELRARILRTISEKCMCDGGILFVSMSEIAQLDSTVVPPSLEKVMDGKVFYFIKNQRQREKQEF